MANGDNGVRWVGIAGDARNGAGNTVLYGTVGGLCQRKAHVVGVYVQAYCAAEVQVLAT